MVAASTCRGGCAKEAALISAVAGAALWQLHSGIGFVAQPLLDNKELARPLKPRAATAQPSGLSRSRGVCAAVAGSGAAAVLLRQGRRAAREKRCHVIQLAVPASQEKAEIPLPLVAAGALAVFAVAEPALAQEAATAVAGAAADAAGAAEDAEEVIGEVAQSGGDWFEPLIQFNAGIIAGIDGVIEDQLHVPNSFGFAIISYTLLIKVLTYPLNQAALRSAAIMQLIKPKIDQVNRKYKNDQETQNRMLLRLYDDCGVNPLGGCIPSIVQFPIFIGLYRSILKLAEVNPKFQEPFLWIPSLAGPSTSGPSLDWLIKSQSEAEFVPLIGWDQAGRYVILPILLIFSQVITQKVSQPDVGNQGGPAGFISNFIPLVIGYTGLVSPAGLGIYWLTNNLVTQGQTYVIRSQLGEEFPEYKKFLDGSYKEEEERKKQEEEEAANKEEEPTGPGRGFGSVADDDEEEEEEKELADAQAARPMKRLAPKARPRRRRR
ncbi:unnamed protein product [Effrenium voratum]|uniref:Membrane insertase YidC/Oxa/ALB C-terminal domain-containing protein n=1 Tax=Effrenium voratum TaxID=2562239 RepID=A0AA36MZY0_9DINO|nr:unnamed protein product [Effrenium voratum]